MAANALAPTFDFDAAPSRVAFDIEIADEVVLAPGEDLDSKGPFAISCAAAVDDRGEVRHWFASGADRKPARSIDASIARAMLAWLRDLQVRGVKVCAWNGLSFDLKWLGFAADDPALAAAVALDLYDPMFQFVVKRGFPIGLAAAAEGFAIAEKKRMRGEDAPKQWALGNHQLVLDYVAGDCRITERVVAEIIAKREIRWRTKKGGISSEPTPALRPVRELLKEPLPDTSWMSEPIPREKFYGWLVPFLVRD